MKYKSANQSGIVYILSADFDYSMQIAPDVGPQIADDYGWAEALICDEAIGSGRILVIDNRLSHRECRFLLQELRKTAATFFVRVVDPYREFEGHYYYEFVRDALRMPKGFALLTYDPVELTEEIVRYSFNQRYVLAPYLYREEFELPSQALKQQNRVLISGQVGASNYILRADFWRRTRRSPIWRPFAPVLRHPGFPDIGMQQQHDIVGDKYVRELSKYRFAFVCSGRTRSEFLKYREVAYAHSAPVGDLPRSLSDCPTEAHIPYSGDLYALFLNTILRGGSASVASAYRNYMRRKRCRETISNNVSQELRHLSAH